MKAAVYYETGPPDVFRIEELPDPPCGPDGLLLDVKAVSIEGGDVLSRAGGEMASKPHIVGYQCAGIIREVGGNVSDRVVGQDDEGGPFDHVAHVGDLPYLLGMTDASDIPPSIELPVLPERVSGMRGRLAGLGPPPHIGVTWRAGTQKRNHLSKIAPLERLAAALRPIGGTVVVVQRNPAAGEIEAFADMLGRDAHDFTALNDDLEGMLALVDLLDDYVCVSNTNLHLRAVRGRASRVLVPHPPEFRWMASGEESPWFPGTRVYRQTTDRDWNPAFAALERDLAAAWSTG